MLDGTPLRGLASRARHVYRTNGVARVVVEHNADGTSAMLRANDVEGHDASRIGTYVAERVGLYRPEGVAAAVERGEWVVVCRTELEADAVAAAGMTGTVLAPSPLVQAGIPLEDVATTAPLAQARAVVTLDPGVVTDPRCEVVTDAAATTAIVRLARPLLTLLDDEAGIRELRAGVMATAPASRGGGDTWPVPIQLLDATAEVPPFPVHAFPGWVGEHVNAVAAALEVDAAMPAAFALGALSTVIAPGCRVQIRPTWCEGTNIYLVVGATSGDRKSPAFDAFFEPVEEIEQARKDAAKLGVITQERMVAVRSKAAKDAEAALMASSGDDEARLVAELESALGALEDARDASRALPKMLVDDSSPEALTRILHEQQGVIAIASSEGLLFDIVGGLYGSGGVNLDAYLKGWSGDTLRVDRGGLRRSTNDISATATIRDPRVTVAIATQPGPLLKAFTDPHLDSRGLTNRFLPVMPPSLVGYRKGPRGEVDPGIAVQWANGLQQLADRHLDRDEPLVLDVTPEAHECWHAWWTAIEARRPAGADLHHLSPWLSKAEAYVWRLAGLLAVADHPAVPATKIVAEHVERAIELIGVFLGHRQALVALGGASPVVTSAMWLLDWLRASRTTVFTRRDAYNEPANRIHFPYAETVDEPLAMLVEAGWIRALPQGKGPGRPSLKFAVNPATHLPTC